MKIRSMQSKRDKAIAIAYAQKLSDGAKEFNKKNPELAEKYKKQGGIIPKRGWTDEKCSRCKGKGYTDHWDNMYGSTKPSCFKCQGTGKVWRD